MPIAQSGDILCVFATGAYNYSMSSNYNRIPRPAAVLVRETKNADGVAPVEIVIKRELPMELLDRDVVPSWL
jgi:diaminopimelate decarboxylase